MRFATVLTTLVLVAGFAVAEDKVTLKDGKVITGTILSVTRNDIQIQTDGEKVRVPRAVVDKAEKNGVLLDLDAASASASAPPASRPRPLPPSRSYEATPALLAWLDVCAGQLAADDEGVRAGATAALLAAGKTVIPALKRAIESDDRTAPIAKRILAQVERREQRKAPSAPRATAAVTQAERLASIGEALNLTDEQEPKFKVIMDDYQRRQSELRQSIRSGEVPISQAGEKTAALRDEVDEKLAEVLTEEQLQNYKKLVPRPENRETRKTR